MLFELSQYPKKMFFLEARKLLRLGLPIFIAQIAQVGIGVVDTVMAGHVSANDLAAVALGSNVFITLYVTFTGIMTALQPILAQLFGASKVKEIGEYGRQGLWFGVMLGCLGMVLLWVIALVLRHHLDLGDYVDQTFTYFVFFISLGMPAAMVHRFFYAFASSLNRSQLIMVASLSALLLNIILNYIFVYGKLGIPAMGGAGCGLASAICIWFNALFLGAYVKRYSYFKKFGLFKRFSWPQWNQQWQIIKLGVPIGLSFFLEISLFTFIVLLVARFGVTSVASQQVVMSITSLLYMLPQSIGTALAICVGQYIGKKSLIRARYLSGIGLSLGFVGACGTGVILILFRHIWAGLYTSDVAVIELTANLLMFAALFQLSDATQTVASYALRGYKIAKIPMCIHAFSFWGLGLGMGIILSFYFNLKLYGFWISLVVALTVAAVFLVWYLNRQSRLFLRSQES